MATTVIGSGSGIYPKPFAPPIIETAPTWQDDWTYDPELQLVSCGVRASGAISSCEIERRYGPAVKMPYDSGFSAYTPRDLSGWWVRVSFLGEQGKPVTQFYGQVESQSRELAGDATHASGKQRWIVYGGLRVLERITISQAVFFNADGSFSTVDWIPPMNSRDKRGLLVGNRNSDPDDNGDYFYGGTGVWTHLQYLQYLLREFVQQGDGPTWTAVGQIDILDGIKTTLRFRDSMTVVEMLRELIPVRYGVDFKIQDSDNGYMVFVFALTAAETSNAGATMPKNPNLLKIIKSDQLDLVETHIVESDERRVDQIVVCGKRIVVCGTLGGTSLVARWSAGLEADYISAGGTVGGAYTPEQMDKIRKRDKYRDVYQHLGAPDGWDMDGGAWAISTDDAGNIISDADFQIDIRETLGWIPLKEGYDYSTAAPDSAQSGPLEWPAKDNTDGAVEADIKPPLAWAYDEAPDNGDDPRFVQCDLVGMSVHRPYHDWGIVIDAAPNHNLAKNHWTPAQIDTSAADVLHYDYTKVLATIAIESDHRLQLVYNVPGNQAAGDGSVKTIVDEESELWVMLPKTTVDLDTAGQTVKSADRIRILRNDVDRLALIMAGAVSKYKNERVRAQLVFRGFLPWGDLVGQILSVVQQGDDIQRVGAPITSVEWTLSPAPTTVIKTGYA